MSKTDIFKWEIKGPGVSQLTKEDKKAIIRMQRICEDPEAVSQQIKMANYVNKLPATVLKDGSQTANLPGTPANNLARRNELDVNIFPVPKNNKKPF
jgi:hypothetical protein